MCEPRSTQRYSNYASLRSDRSVRLFLGSILLGDEDLARLVLLDLRDEDGEDAVLH
jgi:hypothetical protein